MSQNSNTNTARLTVGWREWVSLPDLDIPAIKAKIDTGARTSALHTYELKTYYNEGVRWVRFGLHPRQRDSRLCVHADCEVADQRVVSDSGGHRERRLVIVTSLELDRARWPIEITLTRRENMLFRMLLGRTAMSDRLIVDPSKSYLCGRKKIRRRKERIT